MTDFVSADKAKAAGRGMRIVKWIAFRIPLYYLIAAVLLTLLQRRMIYQPPSLTAQDAADIAARNGFQPWKNSGGKIIGWHLPAAVPSSGAVLVAHGNADCAAQRDYFAKPIFAAASLDVFVLEFPGYGGREGSPSMKSILAAADEGVAILTNRRPLYVVSESLGTGIAAHLAKNHPNKISGLMLFAPYNNLVSVAQRKMPFFPVSLMLWDRYAPDVWLSDYRGPVGFMLAGADEVIPNELGRKLFDGYFGPKKLWVVEGAGHNDVAEQPVEWWKGVFEFWRAPHE